MTQPSAPCNSRRGSRIVIAGFGLLSPLGLSAWETFRALIAGRTLAERAAALPSDIAPVDLVRAVGCVGVAQHTGEDPAVELAERAAREACALADAQPEGLTTFLGTSKGAVAALASGSAVPLAVALGAHGYLAHRLRQRLGLGLIHHHVAACASSLTAFHHARQHLLQPRSGPVALVLTAEAALTPAFIHSYRRLGVLSPLTPADYRQRPLDQRRGGFVLSEMGAAVVLRRLAPGTEPVPGQIELVDTAVACEANDLIRPSRTMPALRHVAGRLLRGPVDVIHPHAPGTAGTPAHDPAELAAYRDALDITPPTPPSLGAGAGELSVNPRVPDLYAAKGAIGHALGAAGLTSLVLACLCLIAGRRPPMPWLADPIAWSSRDGALGEAAPCPRTGAHAVFAAGFAGHVAGAVIRRH